MTAENNEAETENTSEVPETVEWSFLKDVHKSLDEIVEAGNPVKLPLAKAVQFGELVGVDAKFQKKFEAARKKLSE